MESSDWISFKDKQPELEYGVLLWMPGNVCVAHVVRDEDSKKNMLWVHNNGNDKEYSLDNHRFTHWMVIYPPEKEE